MKIFVDTANLYEIIELASWGIVDGVTTNPTLIAKSGKTFNEIIDEIFKIVNGPISLEVVSEKSDDITCKIKQKKDFAEIVNIHLLKNFQDAYTALIEDLNKKRHSQEKEVTYFF